MKIDEKRYWTFTNGENKNYFGSGLRNTSEKDILETKSVDDFCKWRKALVNGECCLGFCNVPAVNKQIRGNCIFG